MSKTYTIGVDYGSLSGRAVLVDTSDGTIVAQASRNYPHGAMNDCLPDGTPLGNGWVVQHPDDFHMVMYETITEVVASSGVPAEKIVGIGIDFTSSTVIPVDKGFRPLSKNPRYESRPHAWPKMWKHTAALPQAQRMDAAVKELGLPYLNWVGGAVPCQSLLPKVIQTYEEDPEIYEHTAYFLEAADYITSLLVGKITISSSIAAARAIWSPETGYPSEVFFEAINPSLKDLPEKLGKNACRAYPGEKIGTLCEEMAEMLGLLPGIAISAPQMDAYAAMPGIGIKNEGEVMLVIGTSTAIMLLSKEWKYVEGITACIPDTYYPGFFGYASGQSSVGDCFQWVVENCVPADYQKEAENRGIGLHQYLTELASSLEPGETGLVALDWLGGNKSCLANSALSGLILGLNLKTKPEHIYRAFQEATAYGCRVVLEAYEKAGIAINKVVACGGIAGKNPELMQMYADILGKKLEVNACTQAPALGSAIYAAAAAGEKTGYTDIFSAVNGMCTKEKTVYVPDPKRNRIYNELYSEYLYLHDLFGRENASLMERLSGRRHI